MPLRPSLDCLSMVLLLFGLGVSVESTATHSLVVQRSVFRGTEMEAVLHTYQPVPGVIVSVSDGNSRQLKNFTLADLSPVMTSMLIEVDLAWSEGLYTLSVAASDGSFTASANFVVLRRILSTFILTDKANYKPSETVNIRVLVTTADLKPFISTISVTVQDAEGHMINQWANEPLRLGVASFSLPLSSNPALGIWAIKVVAGDGSILQTFQVIEYGQPQLSVRISLPTYIIASQSHVNYSISAFYSNGEVGNGWAIVIFKIGRMSLVRTVSVNGTKTFDLGPSDLAVLGLVNAAYKTFEASVEFVERYTNAIKTHSATLQISPYEVAITFFPATSDYFKKGRNFKAYIKVAHPDGSHLGESGLELLVVASFSTLQSSPIVLYTTTVTVPEHGIVAVTIPSPASGTEYFNIRATLNYKGQTIETSKNVSAFIVRGANNIEVTITGTSDSLKSGDTVWLSVSVLQPKNPYYYIAVARRRIVSYGAKRTREFGEYLRARNAPQTTFIVFALGSDGEIVADSVTINVSVALLNKDIESPTIGQATPDDNINDISQEQLLQELLSYATGDTGPRVAASSLQLFTNAGLSISTDAIIEDFSQYNMVVYNPVY